ncbi:MAG: hypothetical protein IEMM0008_0348 [bacterium]|nr:MAG: hypothetical protein IEMM0008_0348 [bacterium]
MKSTSAFDQLRAMNKTSQLLKTDIVASKVTSVETSAIRCTQIPYHKVWTQLDSIRQLSVSPLNRLDSMVKSLQKPSAVIKNAQNSLSSLQKVKALSDRVMGLEKYSSIQMLIKPKPVIFEANRILGSLLTNFIDTKQFFLKDIGLIKTFQSNLANFWTDDAEEMIADEENHGKSQQSKSIIIIGRFTSEQLKYLAHDKIELEQALQTKDPRFLEELVAANWIAEGYKVEIVSRLNAGGPDIIAINRNSVVPVTILTSCKWKNSKNRIKKLDIEELMAWVDSVYPANAGLLATNSQFQSGAIELIQSFPRINALNGNELVAWTIRLWENNF